MKKYSFVSSAALGIVCMGLYIFIEIVEQVTRNILLAYMTVAPVGFSYDMVSFDFANIKMATAIMALIFWIISIFLLIIDIKNRNVK